ncbi:MAG: hypothetical protein ACAH83_11655 [Alphaproteobacteria bacterium]
MSFDKSFVNDSLAGFFNNVSGQKPMHTSFSPSSFEGNKLPGEPDRVVSVRMTDGTMAQMIQKGGPPIWDKALPQGNVYDLSNRMDNPLPPWLKKPS